MTAIANAYINALLADAAYVDLTQGMSEADMKRDLSGRMTPTLAAYIAANFEIVSCKNTEDTGSGSGFDATVWRGKTGDLFYTDLRIGIDGYASPQAIAEYRYIKQLMTPAGQSVQYTEQEVAKLKAIYWDYKPALSLPFWSVFDQLIKQGKQNDYQASLH